MEVQDAYQLPASRGDYGYPLGDDGAGTLYFPPETEYKIRVRGKPLEQTSDCNEYYFSSPEYAESEPSGLKDTANIIIASEDHKVRIAYDVLCGTWFAS